MFRARHLTLPLIAGLAVPVALALQDDPAPVPVAAQEADPEEELQELFDSYDEAMNAFSEEYQNATNDDDRQEVYANRYPKPEEFAPDFFAFVERYPRSEHAAKALAWIVQRVRGEDKSLAIEILRYDHFESLALAKVCQSLRYETDEKVVAMVRELSEKSPHREVRGQACFTLGYQLKSSVRSGAVTGAARDERMAEFEAMMERVVDEYGDLPSYQGTLGEEAGSELFELRNLQIGMAAPNIEGNDLDGVGFKLSDYRGKVVVIDFWGNW